MLRINFQGVGVAHSCVARVAIRKQLGTGCSKGFRIFAKEVSDIKDFLFLVIVSTERSAARILIELMEFVVDVL